MVTLQILNKVILTQDISLILSKALTEEFFPGYEEEFAFILNHHTKYNKVPDKATYLSKFPEFEFIEVEESDSYLLSTLYEEALYYKSVDVIQKVAATLKTDANAAVEYLQSQLPSLQVKQVAEGVDIISKANERYKAYEKKKNSKEGWHIPTGFEELDELIYGWAKGEEFVVIFARTGQGKSWVLATTLQHSWQIGKNVGYISPEMSPDKIGYRFDTLYNHFSNTELVRGKDVPSYKPYIDELRKKENCFIVATPKDFQKKITVTKLKNFCITNKLDILGIDGITYLSDERYRKGDNKNISLTNISEDLIALSVELEIPILVVVQSNRAGAMHSEDEGTPELETIRDSDGIAQNATKVISIRQTGAGLEFGVKKHRDGAAGGKVLYHWEIDTGNFKYIPSNDDSTNPEKRKEKVEEIKQSFKATDKKDVF